VFFGFWGEGWVGLYIYFLNEKKIVKENRESMKENNNNNNK
jgi:hypothetical protein